MDLVYAGEVQQDVAKERVMDLVEVAIEIFGPGTVVIALAVGVWFLWKRFLRELLGKTIDNIRRRSGRGGGGGTGAGTGSGDA